MKISELKDLARQRSEVNEFDVATGDFGQLEIRPADQFHYFYDIAGRRLIRSFVLRSGQKVDTMCDVILAGADHEHTPRLRFWKKDKTKGSQGTAAQEAIDAGESAILVKSTVDLSDAHDGLWRLLEFLRLFEGVTLPSHEFRVTGATEAALLDALQGHDREDVLRSVKVYLGGNLTEADVQLLADRRVTLERFERLLTEADYFESERERLASKPEALWQGFFEENPWIFGYGLTLVSCDAVSEKGLEAITTGSNVFTGGGKRIDAAMRTRGYLQTLVFVEIKRHDTPLLMTQRYRDPDVYQASKELSGAIAQVQKTTHKAIKPLLDLHRQHAPEGDFEFEVSTVAPRMVVIAGHLGELAPDDEPNVEKLASFELFRRNQQGVEVLTFDELLERTRYIVDSGEASAGA